MYKQLGNQMSLTGRTLPTKTILALYHRGMSVLAITRAIKYPPNRGHNRVTYALIKAGVRKPTKSFRRAFPNFRLPARAALQ
jgi:hypothetical protein